MIALITQVVANDESLGGFDRFYATSRGFWVFLFVVVMLLRLLINAYIHYKTESPSVKKTLSNGDYLKEIIPKTHEEKKRLGNDHNTGTPGMRDFEVVEFLLVSLLSFWWTHYSYESPSLANLKKWGNCLNLLAIPLLLLVIIMFFRLQ